MGQVYSYSLIPGPTPAFGDPSSYTSSLRTLKQHQEFSRKNQSKKIANPDHDWNKSIGFLSNEFSNLRTSEAEQQYTDSIHDYSNNQYNKRNLLESNPDILNDDLDSQSHHGLIKPNKLIVKHQRRNKVSSILASARSYLLSSSSSSSTTNCIRDQSVTLRPTKVSNPHSKSNKSKIGCFNNHRGHDYDRHKNGHDLIRSNKAHSSILPSELLEPEITAVGRSKKNESNGLGFFDLKNTSRNGSRGIRLFPVNSTGVTTSVTGAIEASRTNKKTTNKIIDFNTNSNNSESEVDDEEEELTTTSSQKNKKRKNKKRFHSNASSKKCSTTNPEYVTEGTGIELIKNPLVSKLSREEEQKEKEILSRGMSNSFSCYNLHRETLGSSDGDSSRDNVYCRQDSFKGSKNLLHSSLLDSTSTNQSHSDGSSFRRSSIGEDEEAPFIDEDVDEDENGELVSPTSLNCKMSHLESTQMSQERGLNRHQPQEVGLSSQPLAKSNGLFNHHNSDVSMRVKDSSRETSSFSSSSSVATSSLIDDWRKTRRIQPEIPPQPPAVPPFPNPIPRIQLHSPTNCHRTSVKCYQGEMQQPQKPMVFLTSSNKERNANNPMYQETRNGKLVNANGTINRNKTVIQASTSELLRALGDYVEAVISNLRRPYIEFNTHDLAFWLRSVDRSLLIQGWQEIAFVNPANLVFLYLLLKDMIQESIRRHKLNKLSDLQSLTLTCLYISYGYMGNEISYPLKPFLCDSDSREEFFDRALFIINRMSGKMLQINADPSYFTSTFSDLLLGNQHPHQQQKQPTNNTKPGPVRNGSYKSSSNEFSNGHQLDNVDNVNENINPAGNQFIHYKKSSITHSLTSSSSSNNNLNNNHNPLINIR